MDARTATSIARRIIADLDSHLAGTMSPAEFKRRNAEAWGEAARLGLTEELDAIFVEAYHVESL